MKTKLVVWGQKGSEENAERVLLALELNPEENKTMTWIFEGDVANNELAEQLMNSWRKGEAFEMPAEHDYQEKELSAAGTILPVGIISDKMDLVGRTQTEWLFMVLSTKLFKSYEQEIDELQERIEALPKYNKSMWEEMKEFWNKVQAQQQEHNLFREHTDLLRNRTNQLFEKLKQLRQVEDEAFEKVAKAAYDKVAEVLNACEEAIASGTGDWTKWFNRLKDLQKDFKNAKLTRAARTELWERIDKAFKEVKTKRFPNNNQQGTAPVPGTENRLQRRVDGLREAIRKMESSIARDEKELNFQTSKIESNTATMLEAQLRELRSKLITEKVNSKKAKLADMQKTLQDLEARLTRILSKQASEEEIKAAEEEDLSEAELSAHDDDDAEA